MSWWAEPTLDGGGVKFGTRGEMKFACLWCEEG